jgi:hypothetical protein
MPNIKEGSDENNFNAKRRQYPQVQDAFFPQAEPMMDIVSLREAWEYFDKKYNPHPHAWQFFNYLQHLEKDVPLDQQKCNIKFFHKID